MTLDKARRYTEDVLLSAEQRRRTQRELEYMTTTTTRSGTAVCSTCGTEAEMLFSAPPDYRPRCRSCFNLCGGYRINFSLLPRCLICQQVDRHETGLRLAYCSRHDGAYICAACVGKYIDSALDAALDRRGAAG